MKAKTKYGIAGYRGNVDDMIFYKLPNCDTLIGRRRPQHFRQAAQHKDYRQIAQNLKAIQPGEAYKDDFRVYFSLYRDLPEARRSVSGWYNLYVKLMWDLQKAGLADLKTLTREQILDQNLPCISVKAAVEAGFLLPVLNYQRLDNTI